MSDQTSELVMLVLAPDELELQLTGSTLELLENDVLPAFLPKQRWFADKDATLGQVRLVDVVPLDSGTHVDLVVIEIEGSHRMYFVPIAISEISDGERSVPVRATLARVRSGGRDGFLCDAFATDALPRAFVNDIGAGRRRPSSGGGTFVAHAAPAFATLEIDAVPSVRRLSVEQSNTSVIVGETLMLKGYRRVHRGPQPELEVARFLDAVQYANTPTLLGYIEYEHPEHEPIALCIVQRFVESRGDAWGVTLAHLERFFGAHKASQGARTATLSDLEKQADVDEHAIFVALVRTLGQRTAELHRAFATPIGDPGFEPEATTDDDLAMWIEQAQMTAHVALTALERGRDRVPEELRSAADALGARRDEIMKRMAVPSLGAATVMKTRYHGDYHLGQVLVVADDFMIVDFEGEPGRDAAIRRRKSSPLRDVAGMLRSINYAAVAGLRGVTADRGEDTHALEPFAREWEQRNVTAFLDGYRTTIAGCASYPTDPEQAQRLLDLFVLEKAFYEMSYELANRPSWLHIPLEGIRAILDAGQYANTVN